MIKHVQIIQDWNHFLRIIFGRISVWLALPTCKSLYCGLQSEEGKYPTANSPTQQNREQLSKGGMSQYPLPCALTKSTLCQCYVRGTLWFHTQTKVNCTVWFTGFTLGFTLGSVNIELVRSGAFEAWKVSPNPRESSNPHRPRCHSQHLRSSISGIIGWIWRWEHISS